MSDYLNESLVEELVDIMEEDIGMLYETYIADSQEKIVELAEVFKSDDYEVIRRLAHSIKGSSKNVGADGVADLLETIESDAKAESLSDRNERISEINRVFDLTKQEISQRFL